jgi:alkanesulfonate monooxygenase SsuD/methylene tetrahydromethanopterin reductase-like flavin-dependent oxidoreductase (luciferase family)
MKVSISVTSYSWPPGRPLPRQLDDVARRAEDAGVDTVWVADHLLQVDPNAAVEEPMLEAYTTLGFLAALTDRVGLGTMVTSASMRPAALLVKGVTSLDVLTNGRAWLGIGAGYQGVEAAMMGLPFGDTPTRFAQLESAIGLALQMWSGDEGAFPAFPRLAERPIGNPRPVGRPRPRVLIGGMGERRTLPLVARYADACNFFDIPDGGKTLRRKRDALALACAEAGRDAAEVEITLSTRLDPSDDGRQLIERCADLVHLGISHLVLVTKGPWTPELLDTVHHIVAAVDDAPNPTLQHGSSSDAKR